MPKKKNKIRFELQLDVEDHKALLALEEKSKLSRADVVRLLIRKACAVRF